MRHSRRSLTLIEVLLAITLGTILIGILLQSMMQLRSQSALFERHTDVLCERQRQILWLTDFLKRPVSREASLFRWDGTQLEVCCSLRSMPLAEYSGPVHAHLWVDEKGLQVEISPDPTLWGPSKNSLHWLQWPEVRRWNVQALIEGEEGDFAWKKEPWESALGYHFLVVTLEFEQESLQFGIRAFR